MAPLLRARFVIKHVKSCYMLLRFLIGIVIIFILIRLQVMRDPSGISRGSGFVAFSTSEDASRAVSLDYIYVVITYYNV